MMHQVMSPEFFASSPSLQTMYASIVKNVDIRESSIPNAGNGLFAKKNIKSGTIVSFYPAHALGVDTDDDETPFVCREEDTEYFRSHPSTASSYLHCTDQPLFRRDSFLRPVTSGRENEKQKSIDDDDDTTLLYLDANPTKPIVGGWVSQMINDGAVVESNSEEGLLDYYRNTRRRKNCIHIPWGPSPIMATVTTKKVKKGEELFTSYGGTYWLGVLLDVRGEEGVGITSAIQKEIQQTATDLVQSMDRVAITYATQAKAMEETFRKLLLEQR